MFTISDSELDRHALSKRFGDGRAGGFVCFEGWVRNHNEGKTVTALEYQAYIEMALREGERIINEAHMQFDVLAVGCAHRVGALDIGDMAVWVGASAAHRGAAFDACQYVINQVKVRVPIWKKEHYTDGNSGWVNCEKCAAHGHAH